MNAPLPFNMLSDPNGRGYGRKAGTPDDQLMQVGAGTPMGEYLRRFWHPVALSSDATSRPPLVVNVVAVRPGSRRQPWQQPPESLFQQHI